MVLPDVVVNITKRCRDGVEAFLWRKSIPAGLDWDAGRGTDLLLLDLLGDLGEFLELPFFTVSFPDNEDALAFSDESRETVEKTVKGILDTPFLCLLYDGACGANHSPEGWPDWAPYSLDGAELLVDQLRGGLLDLFDIPWPVDMRPLLRCLLCCTYLVEVVDALAESFEWCGISWIWDIRTQLCGLREEVCRVLDAKINGYPPKRVMAIASLLFIVDFFDFYPLSRITHGSEHNTPKTVTRVTYPHAKL